MANINDGNPIRFESAGILTIGSDTVLLVEPGSVQVTYPMRRAIVWSDRGVMNTAPKPGDEVEGEIRFQVRPSKNGMTSASNLQTVLRAAATGDAYAVYSVRIQVPDSPGAATGTDLGTFQYCYLKEPFQYGTRGGDQDLDLVTVVLGSRDSTVTPATY